MVRESEKPEAKAKEPFAEKSLRPKFLAATSDSHRMDFHPLERLFAVD